MSDPRETDFVSKLNRVQYVSKKKKELRNFDKYGNDDLDLRVLRNINQNRIRKPPNDSLMRDKLVKKISTKFGASHSKKKKSPPKRFRGIKKGKKNDPGFTTSMIRKVKELEQIRRKQKQEMDNTKYELQRVRALLKLQVEREDELCEICLELVEHIDKNNANPKLSERARSIIGSREDIPVDDDDIPSSSKKSERVINMAKIKKRIEQLNHLVSEDRGIVQGKDGFTKFGEMSEVTITFYKNGLTLNNGAFRPYEWQITSAFLEDILDGYFPFEFKEKYPDGVKIHVLDKTSVIYTKSHKMSNDLMNNRVSGMNSLKKRKKEVAPDTGGLSKTQFLKKIPKQVVKNGEIINVRDEVRKYFGDAKKSSEALNVVEDEFQEDEIGDTTAYKEHQSTGMDADKKDNIAIIKIRVPKRKISKLRNITLHLYKDQTIADLRKEIDKFINFMGETQYSLRLPPREMLCDEAKTIVECGMFPNAILHVVFAKN